MMFRYTGIRILDLERSIAFYQDVMGMKVLFRGKMHHGGVYVHLESPRSKQRLELNWYPSGNRFHSAYRKGDELDHLAFMVEDVRTRFKDIIKGGASVAVKPWREGNYDIAFVKDPDGIWIELMGPIARRKKR